MSSYRIRRPAKICTNLARNYFVLPKSRFVLESRFPSDVWSPLNTARDTVVVRTNELPSEWPCIGFPCGLGNPEGSSPCRAAARFRPLPQRRRADGSHANQRFEGARSALRQILKAGVQHRGQDCERP